jgi:hypothetical protein
VLPLVWPGTQSAYTVPSPKTSTTPSKAPAASGANGYSDSALPRERADGVRLEEEVYKRAFPGSPGPA